MTVLFSDSSPFILCGNNNALLGRKQRAGHNFFLKKSDLRSVHEVVLDAHGSIDLLLEIISLIPRAMATGVRICKLTFLPPTYGCIPACDSLIISPHAFLVPSGAHVAG